MAVSEPIDPRVRLAISQWPDDAPRGAVSTFCAEHGISRKSFYALRKRAMADGQAAVLEPRTRRPNSSPSRLSDEVKAQAVAVRAALDASGLDHGPSSRTRAPSSGAWVAAMASPPAARWRASTARRACCDGASSAEVGSSSSQIGRGTAIRRAMDSRRRCPADREAASNAPVSGRPGASTGRCAG